MKLLYIHQYFRFPEQSGGTRSYDLATSFVKEGIDVTVISSMTENGAGKSKWSVYEREGIKFYMLHCPYNNSMSFRERISAFISFMWHASVKAMQIDCDCILATSTPLTIAVPALFRKWFKKTPFIFEVRDVWPEVPIKMGFIKNKLVVKGLYWFEKLVYKNASYIVPLSIGMDANIKTRYPNSKSVVIPNISEISRFSEVKQTVELNVPTNGKKIVLYAGTFGNVNGIGYVVDLAAETIKIDADILFFLFGNGKEKQHIEEYAEEKGVLDKNLFIFNPVKKSDLPYLYSIATVGSSFVINNPVLWDNSANKFFDTLAAGKPVVINHKGWQADAIHSYNIGYELPVNIDVNAAKAFVDYMNDVALWQKQSDNAKKVAKDFYSLEVAVSKYLMILKKME